jgi:hypothetical protein
MGTAFTTPVAIRAIAFAKSSTLPVSKAVDAGEIIPQRQPSALFSFRVFHRSGYVLKEAGNAIQAYGQLLRTRANSTASTLHGSTELICAAFHSPKVRTTATDEVRSRRVNTDDQTAAALQRAGCKTLFKDEGISGATAKCPAISLGVKRETGTDPVFWFSDPVF